MVSYRLAFRPEAQQDLKALDEPVRERIFDKLKWLANNFKNLRPYICGRWQPSILYHLKMRRPTPPV